MPTREPAKFLFTVKALKEVQCPPSGRPNRNGRVFVYDARVPGLAFCVTESGDKTYWLCRRVNGKYQRIRIGTAGFDAHPAAQEFTIDQARTRAGELNSEIARNIDPMAAKREARAAASAAVATLSDLWDLYKTEHLTTKKPGTAAEFERLYEAHLTTWKNKPLQQITKEECRALHKRIGAHSKFTANRVLAILSAMFRSKGAELGMPEDWTPTAKIKHYPENARDRVLSPEEMARVLAAIDADDNELVRDYFRMMLYTGSRKTKLAQMRWQEISIQRKTWAVPGVTMKNDMPLVVNLVDEAVAILNRRADHNPTDSPYVFPAHALTAAQVERVRELANAKKSSRQIARLLGISQSSTIRAMDPAFKAEAPRPFNGVQKAWERIMDRAGITVRTTPHDVRRTYVTSLLESGAALMHVAAAVGHRSMETTQKHYSVARQGKVADAVRAGVAAMLGEAEAARATADAKKKKKTG